MVFSLQFIPNEGVLDAPKGETPDPNTDVPNAEVVVAGVD